MRLRKRTRLTETLLWFGFAPLALAYYLFRAGVFGSHDREEV